MEKLNSIRLKLQQKQSSGTEKQHIQQIRVHQTNSENQIQEDQQNWAISKQINAHSVRYRSMDQYFEDIKHKLEPVIERRRNLNSLMTKEKKKSIKLKLSEMKA